MFSTNTLVSVRVMTRAAIIGASALLAACGSPEPKSENADASPQSEAQSQTAETIPVREQKQTKPSQQAASGAPAIGWDSILQTKIYENGYLGFNEYDLIFAPPGQVDANVVIKSKKSEVAKFDFFPDYRYTQAVFGRIQPVNHSEYTFTPGDYSMEFYVSGELATRVPFKVVADAPSGDAFNPEPTLRFVGPWQKFAYLTFKPFKDIEAVEFSFWAGSGDLPVGITRAPVNARLTRNGKLVAHSKETQGMLDHEMARRHALPLFQPHERREEANVALLTKTDIEQNGTYKLTLELTETGEVIRSFNFKSKGGKLVPLPRTELGYKPRADYIAPRVGKIGSTTYEFIEAYWLEAK